MHLHFPSPLRLALRYPSLIYAVLIACTLPSLAVAAAVEESTDVATVFRSALEAACCPLHTAA